MLRRSRVAALKFNLMARRRNGPLSQTAAKWKALKPSYARNKTEYNKKRTPNRCPFLLVIAGEFLEMGGRGCVFQVCYYIGKKRAIPISKTQKRLVEMGVAKFLSRL